ncbi:hypothetical protein [Streptomyces sp. Je 1-332]|uniref:hypothetical protein n=1 Tax=Streptomyces sp. Je 1-332 TaxID=3231270 RepID=UPI00345B4C36
MKVILLLGLLRLFAGPMSEDFLGDELLPPPTWEWSLCALTPGLLIYLARSPEDWEALRGERTMIQVALCLYLLYALSFAIVQNVLILWIAVAACLAGFAGMWHLNRKERLRAG